MAVQPFKITPCMPLSGRNCKKPWIAARTDKAAPLAFTTRMTGLSVFCASSKVLARVLVSPSPS